MTTLSAAIQPSQSFRNREHQDGEHCLMCGKYVSTDTGYTDYDWSHRYPTFGAYCDDKCADAKRAKTDPAWIEKIERANGSWQEKRS